jgi:hypothetical protein
MKTINRILFLAATTTGLAFTFPALAGGPEIAASPKVRQMLNDRAAVVSAPTSTSSTADRGTSDNLAASPKVQQVLSSRPTPRAASTMETATVSRPNDGIAAPPKLREQLNERSMQFQIAPIK